LNAQQFPISQTLFGADDAATFIAQLKANQTAQVKAYSAYSTDSTVLAGYNASYNSEVNDIYPSPVGQAEFLMSNTGAYGAWKDTKAVAIQFALQHPLSRGVPSPALAQP
jgi:choline dehydrogenase